MNPGPRQRLTMQQEAFALGMATSREGETQLEVYRRAYPNAHGKDTTIAKDLQRQLAHPLVKARIAALRAQVTRVVVRETGLDQARMIQEYTDIIEADIRDYVEWDKDGVMVKASSELTKDQAKIVKSVKQRTDRQGTVTVDIELADRVDALNQAAQRFWPVPKEPEQPKDITVRVLYENGQGKAGVEVKVE